MDMAALFTFYTTSGVLRTIELILGLPPMSQGDASATPLVNAFLGTPSLAAHKGLPPPRRSLFVSPASRVVDADNDQPRAMNRGIW